MIISRQLNTGYLRIFLKNARDSSYTLPCQLWLLIDHSVFHHELHAPQGRNVVSWVAFDGDQVGKEADTYTADLVFLLQHPCVDRSRGSKGVYQGHPKINHRFDLTGVVAVGKDANVAAVGDGNASF